jgi:hypothetical protein
MKLCVFTENQKKNINLNISANLKPKSTNIVGGPSGAQMGSIGSTSYKQKIISYKCNFHGSFLVEMVNKKQASRPVHKFLLLDDFLK